jgi:hypothetical protein
MFIKLRKLFGTLYILNMLDIVALNNSALHFLLKVWSLFFLQSSVIFIMWGEILGWKSCVVFAVYVICLTKNVRKKGNMLSS